METGRVNPKCKIDTLGVSGLGHVYYNLLEPALIEQSVKRGESKLGLGGTVWKN